MNYERILLDVFAGFDEFVFDAVFVEMLDQRDHVAFDDIPLVVAVPLVAARFFRELGDDKDLR